MSANQIGDRDRIDSLTEAFLEAGHISPEHLEEEISEDGQGLLEQLRNRAEEQPSLDSPDDETPNRTIFTGTRGAEVFDQMMRQQAEQEQEMLEQRLEMSREIWNQDGSNWVDAGSSTEEDSVSSLGSRIAENVNKQVLFIGGPIDGQVKQINQHDHYHVVHQAPDPIAPPTRQEAIGRVEKTLIIVDGEEQWHVNWQEDTRIRTETQPYRYNIQRIEMMDNGVRRHCYLGLPPELVHFEVDPDTIVEVSDTEVPPSRIYDQFRIGQPEFPTEGVTIDRSQYRGEFAYTDSQEETNVNDITEEEASLFEQLQETWNSMTNSISFDSNSNNNDNDNEH